MIWIILIPVWFTVGFVGRLFFGVLNDRFGILSSKWRFPAYALSSLLAFLILFGDELVGKWQLENLCHRNNSNELVSAVAKEMRGKTLTIVTKNLPNINSKLILIEHSKNIYEDADNGEIYFIEDVYRNNAGWLKKFLYKLGFSEGLNPVINSDNCPNALFSYTYKYKFKVTNSGFAPEYRFNLKQ